MGPAWLLLAAATALASPLQETGNENQKNESVEKPDVYSMHIHSDIKYRYANTLVSSRVVNPSSKAQEYSFHVVIPDAAFITGFVMTINGTDYRAHVDKKEEAKIKYDLAVSQGQAAAHVAYNARDSNDFLVSVNIEPQAKVVFNLTYEDFLDRQLGKYEHKINVNPGQIVKDLKITVNIEDTSPIISLDVPELQLSNEISDTEKPNSLAEIEKLSDNKRKITWAPSAEKQTEMKAEGLSGQFIVRYDVDRSKNVQQILVNDGYFVHFFSDDELPSLNKYVIFVLDLSGSMAGRKIEQLRAAMDKILSDLKESDYFSIVLFSNSADIWEPNKEKIVVYPYGFTDYTESEKPVEVMESYILPANKTNIEKAREYVKTLKDSGGTNIIAGLRLGLKLVDLGIVVFDTKKENEVNKPQPIIFFLTDGEPNIEESNPKVITEKTTEMNKGKSTIFSLGFGEGADIQFLRNLSLANNGLARSIYEASDAALQLEKFYKTISSPLLSKIKFQYLPGQIEDGITKSEFVSLYYGSELVVAGKLSEGKNELKGSLIADGKGGPQEFVLPDAIVIDHIPSPPLAANKTYGPLEKMWAYKNIKQLIDDNTVTQNTDSKKKALDLALKYSFVTPLTSLVVVKPNSTTKVDAEKLDKPFSSHHLGFTMLNSGSGFAVGSAAATSMITSNSYAAGIPGPPGAMTVVGWGDGTPLSIPGFPSGGLAAPTGGMTSGIFPGFPPPPQSALPPKHYSTTRIPFMPPVQEEASATISSGNASAISRVKVDYQNVTWLIEDVKEKEGKMFLVPPSIFSPALIALNETSGAHEACQVGATPGHCTHFVYCALDTFATDINVFINDYKCIIETKYLGVCCPDSIQQTEPAS